MKRYILLLISFCFALLLNAQVSKIIHVPATPTVVIDPATIDPSTLENGFEVVTIDGTKYIKVTQNGWNNWTPIPQVNIPEDATHFRCMAKYEEGTSGQPVAGVNTFLQLFAPGWDPVIGNGGAPSSTVFKEYQFALTNKGPVGIFQVAAQSTSTWGAISNAIQYIGKVEAIKVGNTLLSYGNSGGDKTIQIVSDLNWIITSDQSWLALNKTSGTGTDIINLTATVFSENTIRTATVTIHADGYDDQMITVTQSGILEITAGNLKSVLAGGLTSLTNLTLTGTIDARDFKTMRDDMPLLAELDLSGATIVAYNGPDGTSIWGNNNYEADAVPETAFMNANWQGKNSLTSVILPASLVSLGQNSFYKCNGLTTITFPSMCSTIGDDTFSFCSGLTSVYIPSSVTTIGDRAFMVCTGLINVDDGNPNYSSLEGVLFNKQKTRLIQCPTSKIGVYSIPQTVTNIGDYAFYSCTNLDGTMTIPINVSSIGQSAFSFCRNLDFVNIPSSVTNIGGYAFYNCGGNFTVDNGNPNYSSQDGILFNKTKTTLIQCGSSRQGNYQIPSTVSVIGPSAFSRCDNLTGVIIPTSVTTIGTNAFWGCVSMTGSISIPSSVNTIGNYAFSGCTALTALYSLAIIPVDLSSSQQVFYNVNKTTCTLNVPYGTASRYAAANQWQDFTNIVEAADGFNINASSIGIEAAAGSTATVNITANVAWSASSDQTWLTVSPTSGTGNQTLTFTAEANTSIATRIAIVTVSATGVDSQTITIRQAGANIPLALTAGGLASALTPEQLAGITNLTLTGTIDARDFKTMRDNMPLLAELDLSGATIVAYNGPGGTSIWGYNNYEADAVPETAFMTSNWQGKISLTSVNLPSGLKSISRLAFYYCYGLTSISIPSSVTTIGSSAFSGCTGITAISIPASVISIGSYAFGYFRAPINVDASNPNYSSLDGVLFNKDQTSLIQCPVSKTGIYTIPSSVVLIERYAFQGCNQLTSFSIPTSVTSIGSSAFRYCNNVTSINVSKSVPLDLSSSDGVFYGVNTTTCTLNVPYGAKAAYQAANQWQDFTNIVEATDGFNINASSIGMEAAAGSTANVELTANVDWTAGSDQAWLTVSPTSGTGDQTLTFTAEANTSRSIRTATITVSATGVDSQTITITQAGANIPLAVTAGGLSTAITAEELAGITRLTLTGTIDARDFKTMRDNMPLLSQLDISAATIVAYNGSDGTSLWGYTTYNANEMPEFALYSKSVLTTILLPSSITTINAFALGWVGLTSISIPESVTSIGNYAFEGCQNMTTISIPVSVTSIGYSAFSSCYGLTSLTIPSSVTTISSNAFRYCSNLNSITVSRQIPLDLSSYEGIFYPEYQYCTLNVPYGTASRYQAANQWQDFTNIVEATDGFNINASSIGMEAAAGSTTTVDITANVAWTAGSDQTWLTVSPTSGTGNQTLTFTAEANPSTTSTRVATVTVSATDLLSQTITVTQQMTIDPTKLDAFEPDNSIATASTITSGVMQQHSIYPIGDEDYASFEVANAPVEVNIRFIAVSGGRNIQLIAPDGTTVLNHNYEQTIRTITENGIYYIRAWNPDNQLVDSYQLSLNIKPIILDKYEPDNTWEQATEILPFFEQDDHNIKLWGDVDYLKFTVSDAPRTVYVDVYDNQRNCNSFGVWLYDTDGTTQLNYSYTRGQRCGYSRLQQNITVNGTYFIKVAVPQGDGGMRDAYTIKVTTDGTAPVIVCNASDRAALVAIYNATNGHNWNGQQGWLSDNVQNWQGVTLNAEGRVTKLNLTRNNLRGTIPTEIGNLTALRYLNLGNNRYVENWSNSNYFYGSVLPASMANLVNLEVLSLDQLQFNTELPDVFSGMVNLRELYLNENYFTNAQLPAGLLNCSKLERLIFPYNNFSQLPNLTSLANIQEILAYRNRLTFEDIEPNASISGFNYFDQAKIGQPLGLNPDPGSTVSQTIEVGGEHNQYQWYKNDLPLEGQTTNTLFIENISTADAGIYQLRVTNTVATQLTLYSEPIALYQKELPIYKALEAFYNSTGGPNWNNNTNWLSDEPLSTWFGIYQENGWNSLQLYGNNLVGQLPASMGDLTLFAGIYIQNNPQLNSSIPESIGNLTQLQSLYLYSNALTGEIPATIGNLKNLRYFHLDNNQLSGSVPATITGCTNLNRLSLNNNRIENLPDLSAMTNLRTLYAYNNRFEFDDLESTRTGKPNMYFEYNPQAKFGQAVSLDPLPGSLFTQTFEVGGEHNLYQWYKDNQPMEGQTSNTLTFQSISKTDAGIYELRVTNTVATQLTLFSEAITLYQKEMPLYKALEAFYNSTGGDNWNNNTNWLSDEPISTWFGIYQENGWNSLQFYGNNLVGQLPTNMGDLTLFTGIHIRFNPQLTGAIPESIGNLSNLTDLDLYSNGLTGEIPSSIGNLKNLSYLQLGYNQLNGSVPATIIGCTNLNGLYLSNNRIENLPDLSAMTNLRELYAWDNRFEFDDLAPIRTGKPNLYFPYDPQAKFGQAEIYATQPGEALTLTATVGGIDNLYQWYKDGILIDGKTSNTLVFDALLVTDRGTYLCMVTNPDVPNLTLESENMLIVDPALLDAFEPDNTIATASTIVSGVSQEHNIYPIGDIDYAKFELTNAPANVDVRFIASSGGRNIQIIAPDGTTLLTWDYEQSSLTLTQNGTYYIRAWNPDNQLVDSYQLSLNITPIYLVTQILLTDGTITTDNGTLQMSASILPANATNQNLIWTVENVTGRAIIDTHTGLLTARMNGTVTVKARATDGTGIEGTAVVTISGQVPQLTDFELIRNGNFIPNGGLPYPWAFWSGNGGSTPMVVGGFAVCTPSQDINIWNYQFNQSGLEALPNTDYIFTFTAWADAERQITVDFEDTAENNYNRYGSSSDSESRDGMSEWTFGITTVPTTYTFHVNFDKMVSSTIQKVNFMLAASSDVVYFDRVSLISVADYQLVNPLIANAGSDQSVNEGGLVTLDGSASTDSKGRLLTYKWTAPEGITFNSTIVAKPTFIAPEVSVNTKYAFSLVVNNGIWDSPANQVVVTVINTPKYFVPAWTGNGVDLMKINIYSAKLDGVELEAGDEIGIFDGAICVGSGILNETISLIKTLDIAVSRNDGAGNGYTSGNAITFRLYDKSVDLEIPNVTAVYSNTDPSWTTDGKFAAGVTAFAELAGLTKVKQDIALNTGWNIISANVVPGNLNLKDIFQALIDAGTLKKVMDETGKTIENFGSFGGWKNNIGNLNLSKGYKVNVTTPTALSLEGIPVQLPFNVNLNAGWNIISYPSATAQDAKALVQSLIDSGKLKKVMDETGKTIENFGSFGGWKNNIGNFLAGKGYKVNVTDICTLTIPANSTKAATIVPEVLASTHFTNIFKGNGTDHMSINLVNLQESGLKVGDEIGVFDGESCVGSAMIGSDQLRTESISIAASANDEMNETVNGFTSGHSVELKLYRQGQTYLLNYTKLSEHDSFEKNGSLFSQANINELTAVQLTDNSAQFRCFPNPFTQEMTIEVQNLNQAEITVEIYNLTGQRIKNLYKGTNSQQLVLKWNGTNDSGRQVSSGVYLCKVNGQSKQVIFKGGNK